MTHFLKREWENTQIPESVYLRARNRAWQRLQSQPRPTRRHLAYLAGALATTVLLVLITFRRPVVPAPQQLAELPVEVARSSAPIPLIQPKAILLASERRGTPASPHIARADTPVPQAADPSPAQSGREERSQDRLVLNFQLPESGVRLIWIKDKSFVLFEGGFE